MPQAATTGDQRDARATDVTHTLLALMAGILGPPILSIVYLVAAAWSREATGAQGYARAQLDSDTYIAYVVALAIFVALGTWKCRGTLARSLFAITSTIVALFSMFVAFFSQMAP